MGIYILELIIIYILGFICLYILKNKKMFLFSSFSTMSFILGARGNSVGEDTQHFIDIFHMSKSFPLDFILRSGTETVYEIGYGYELKIENGYFLLNKLISMFTNNEQYFLFIVAILTCFLFAKFIYDNTNYIFIATQIFLCESMYMSSFNLMRQMLAISIGVHSYTLLKENRYLKALFIILLAMMFHKSAVILFVLYPLFLIKDYKKLIKYLFCCILLFLTCFQFFINIFCTLFPKYTNYFFNNYWNISINGQLILYFFEIVLCFLIYVKGIKNKEIGIQISTVILYLFFDLLGLKIVAFSRVALYFRCFLILLFPNFLSYLKENVHIFYLLILLIIITSLFFSYASSNARIYVAFWNVL